MSKVRDVVVTASTLFLFSPYIQAREGAASVRLTYEAPSVCPTEIQFGRQVEARTRKLRFVPHGVDRVNVRIAQRSLGFGSEVRIFRGAEWVAHRQLDDLSCAVLSEALSLIVALAFDPKAGLESAAPVEPTTLPETRSEPVAPSAEMPQEARPNAEHRMPSVHAPSDRSAPTWEWAAGAAFRIRSGIAPKWRPDMALFVGLGDNDAGWWSPSVRMSGYRTSSGVVHAASGSAELLYLGGSLEGCSCRWKQRQVSIVGPCTGLEIGAVRAEGQLDVPRRRTRLWLAWQNSARIQWRYGWLLTEFQATVGLLPRRYRFEFTNPDVTIHEVPAVYGLVGIGVGGVF